MPNSFPIPLTQTDRDIIDGSLLSDGCITKRAPHCKNYCFVHSSAAKSYVEFIQKDLSFRTAGKYHKPRTSPISSKIFSPIVGNGSYDLLSPTSETFTEYRRNWYPNGKKIVPIDLELTQTTLLHWWLGDGTLDNGRGVVFCTEGFDKTSLQRLSDKLTPLFPNYINPSNRIVIYSKYVTEFFQLIGPPPVSDYAHKWKTTITNSYFARPCKQCTTPFNASMNHQKFCSELCCDTFHKIAARKICTPP
jgi:hypothetical protein